MIILIFLCFRRGRAQITVWREITQRSNLWIFSLSDFENLWSLVRFPKFSCWLQLFSWSVCTSNLIQKILSCKEVALTQKEIFPLYFYHCRILIFERLSTRWTIVIFLIYQLIFQRIKILRRSLSFDSKTTLLCGDSWKERHHLVKQQRKDICSNWKLQCIKLLYTCIFFKHIFWLYDIPDTVALNI